MRFWLFFRQWWEFRHLAWDVADGSMQVRRGLAKKVETEWAGAYEATTTSNSPDFTYTVWYYR